MALTYVKAVDQNAASTAGSRDGAAFIAGGTCVVDLLRLGVQVPNSLVDIGALSWSKIEETPEGLRIGALVRNTELAYAASVRDKFPVLSEALLSGASAQLRNMASVGGNLLQRTRCSYFRDPAWAACNKRNPGSGCAAISGYTRMHAILGGSDSCIAANPSDMCVALVALDAVVHTVGNAGARSVPIADFHTLPMEHPEIESVLDRGELVSHVMLPHSAFARHSAYVKVRDRASYAFALASAAAALELQGDQIRSVRIALGGVATKPWRSREAEDLLTGKPANREQFVKAAKAAVHAARSFHDNAFKVELVQQTIVRALEQAQARGRA
jgi:xanthine dehydrogenase YagS FAD-binding subunit